MDAIHSAGVFGWVEHPHVSFVHAQAWKPSICCPLSQDGAGVGVPLDGDDWGVSKNEVCEYSTACSCE
jgi:hypothetical protein